MSYKNCIKLKCYDCSADETAAGTALEKIADCPVLSCPLHELRPLPRHCRKGGKIDPSAIAAISAKLRAIDRRWAEEGR